MECDLPGLLRSAADQIDALAAQVREDADTALDGDPADGQPDYYAHSLREAAAHVAGVEAERDRLRSRVEALEAEKDRLAALVQSLSGLAHTLTELLAKRAENEAVRVAELEAALAPFAKLLLLEWDRSGAPADALYPVRLGDLRQAARALAGTTPASAAPRVG